MLNMYTPNFVLCFNLTLSIFAAGPPEPLEGWDMAEASSPTKANKRQSWISVIVGSSGEITDSETGSPTIQNPQDLKEKPLDAIPLQTAKRQALTQVAVPISIPPYNGLPNRPRFPGEKKVAHSSEKQALLLKLSAPAINSTKAPYLIPPIIGLQEPEPCKTSLLSEIGRGLQNLGRAVRNYLP
jgi:hypothetical protein